MNKQRQQSNTTQHSYALIYKPYGVLCQFTDESGRRTLADLGSFPRDMYPVGRLDADSEGLVLLSNDGPTKARLLDPRSGHSRTYLVQVERIPSEISLEMLRAGVSIEGRVTKEAVVRLLAEEPDIPPREVPIRLRKNVPTAWIELTITEGRNRQVRKMTAAVGHPTLRLIRIRIGHLTLDGLKPGGHRYLSPAEAQNLLTTVL